MKILIAADMEGISGVVDWNHVDDKHPEYGRFRHLMTADINAAVRGAFNGGASSVAITDGHGSKTNILVEELDGRAVLNTGSPTPLSMVQGLQAGVDAVFFIGYHARAGMPDAVLSHTISGSRVANIWINGRVTGEIGINASVSGHFGAPVLLISSDAAGCAEAADWIQGIRTVVTKTAKGRYAAACLHPKRVQVMIEKAAEEAVRDFAAGKAPAPLATPAPVQIMAEFLNPAQADQAALFPGARRLDGTHIELNAPDMARAYQSLRTAIMIPFK